MEAAPSLRPLRVGEVLDVAIKIVWRNARTLIMAVLVVALPLHLLGLAMTLSTAPDDAHVSLSDFSTSPTATTNSEPSGAYIVAQVLTVALGLLTTTLALATCFKAIGDAYLGARASWKDSLAYVLRRAHSVLWLTLLIYSLSGLAAIALIAPGVWLWVAWTVAVPALLLEGYKGRKALGRSFRLVRGRWWPTFAAVSVGAVLASVAGFIIAGLIVAPALAAADNATVGIVANGLATIASALVTTPFQAAIAAVIYFDLRVRKEGFDLQLLAERLGLPAPAPGQSLAPVGGAPDATGGDEPPYWPPPPGWRPRSAAEE